MSSQRIDLFAIKQMEQAEPQSNKSGTTPQSKIFIGTVLGRGNNSVLESRLSSNNHISMPNGVSHGNDRSFVEDREESKSVRSKILNHVPQIEKRSPDSNPISDFDGMDDTGQLSSDEEKGMFKVPASINESQILRQSMASHRASDKSPKPVVAASLHGVVEFGDATPMDTKKKESTGTAAFEKFDFNDVQMTQRSGKKGVADVKVHPPSFDATPQFFEDFQPL
jgi:hypothetical protein